MKDWQVYVIMGVITFLYVDFAINPNGSIAVTVTRIVIEMLERIG